MLIIPNALMHEMKAHAAEGYPHEIVGVMAGGYEANDKRVMKLFPGTNQFSVAEADDDAAAQTTLKANLNVEGSAANRYFMTANEMRAIDAVCREEGIDIIGFYHTHPDHPARPSSTDLHFAQQTLPGYSYVIMAVENGAPALTTCWVVSEDESRFEEESITVE